MKTNYKELFDKQNIKYTQQDNILEFATTRDYVKAVQVLFDLKVSYGLISGTKKIRLIV